jgi:hypothetical protein
MPSSYGTSSEQWKESETVQTIQICVLAREGWNCALGLRSHLVTSNPNLPRMDGYPPLLSFGSLGEFLEVPNWHLKSWTLQGETAMYPVRAAPCLAHGRR